MSNGRNKYQARESRKQVYKILLSTWDPIGIEQHPPAQHQYDRYGDKAYVMLMDEQATSAEIAAYLLDIAEHHMGLTGQPALSQRSIEAAELIVALRPTFQTH